MDELRATNQSLTERLESISRRNYSVGGGAVSGSSNVSLLNELSEAGCGGGGGGGATSDYASGNNRGGASFGSHRR